MYVDDWCDDISREIGLYTTFYVIWKLERYRVFIVIFGDKIKHINNSKDFQFFLLSSTVDVMYTVYVCLIIEFLDCKIMYNRLCTKGL